MKRILIFILIIACVFSLAGCGGRAYKRDVFQLVKRNYDEILAACESKDSQSLLAMEGIKDVRIIPGYVFVYCKGAGIAPSSQYYGFYYTKDNFPVGVDCNLDIACYRISMQPKGKGFEGIVQHNSYYTEQIKDNIYFYSNAY